MTELASYLAACFKRSFSLCPVDAKKLPLLFSRYNVMEVTEGGKTLFIVLVDKMKFPVKVKHVAAHLQWITEILGSPAVYVAADIPRLTRFRCRAKGIEYIIPGSEMFMPTMGCVLANAHVGGKTLRSSPKELGFPARRFILAYLNHMLAPPITRETLRQLFGYSSVTVIAAVRQLEYAGIVSRASLPHSRKEQIVFNFSGRELWEKSLASFGDPIASVISVDELPSGLSVISGGESALSERTMLNPPEQQVLVCSPSGSMKQILAGKAVAEDDGAYRVELWKYQPLLPGCDQLDDLSLWISTRHLASDPRVEGERDTLLEHFKW